MRATGGNQNEYETEAGQSTLSWLDWPRSAGPITFQNPAPCLASRRLRVYHYYLPVFFWCQEQLALHKATGSKKAMIVRGCTYICGKLYR